eukprot:m.776001 g.776001  ORF g.776001 m.776001 type:complete len:626 (+) comp23261_c0_seq5:366-2243(+)
MIRKGKLMTGIHHFLILWVSRKGSTFLSCLYIHFWIVCLPAGGNDGGTVLRFNDRAKDAARTLKKKLSSRKGATAMKALVLLESCVKNCGHEFHLEVAEKSFVDTLWKLVTGKSPALGVVRNTALNMIQKWAEAFRNDVSLGSIRELYLKLLGEGIEFPTQNLSGDAPIITPDINPAVVREPLQAQQQRYETAISAPSSATSDEVFARQLQEQFQNEDAAARGAMMAGRGGANTAMTTQSAPSSTLQPQQQQYRTEYRVQLIPEGKRVMATTAQLTKLREDMAIVWQNARLLGDLVNALGPNESAKDNELIGEVATTCDAMQKRAAKLCEQVENEDLISELLTVNDALNEAQHKLRMRISQEAPTHAPVLRGMNLSNTSSASGPEGPSNSAPSAASWAMSTMSQSSITANDYHSAAATRHGNQLASGSANGDSHGYASAAGRGPVSHAAGTTALFHTVGGGGADDGEEQPPLYAPVADNPMSRVGAGADASDMASLPHARQTSDPFDTFAEDPPMFSTLPSTMHLPTGTDEPDMMATPTSIPQTSHQGLLVDLGDDAPAGSGKLTGNDHPSLLLGDAVIDYAELDSTPATDSGRPLNILGDGTVRGLSSSQQKKLDKDHDALFAL